MQSKKMGASRTLCGVQNLYQDSNEQTGGENTNQCTGFPVHKRFPCLIYQTLTTPDILVFHLYGPEAGRHCDMILVRKSGLDSLLENNLIINWIKYCLHGDAAYVLRFWFHISYSREGVTFTQLLFKNNYELYAVGSRVNLQRHKTNVELSKL